METASQWILLEMLSNWLVYLSGQCAGETLFVFPIKCNVSFNASEQLHNIMINIKWKCWFSPAKDISSFSNENFIFVFFYWTKNSPALFHNFHMVTQIFCVILFRMVKDNEKRTKKFINELGSTRKKNFLFLISIFFSLFPKWKYKFSKNKMFSKFSIRK